MRSGRTAAARAAALATVLVAGAGAGCAGPAEGPPAIEVDRSACARCSMLISEPRYAAAYRIDGRTELFDEIGCMAAALVGEEGADEARLWFRDVVADEWRTPEQVRFVVSDRLPTPMAGGVVATDDAEAAASLARRYDGEVFDAWSRLRSELARKVHRKDAPTTAHGPVGIAAGRETTANGH